VSSPLLGVGGPRRAEKGANSGFSLMCKLLSDFSMWHCDELLNPDNRETYCNEALGHACCIDHVFVSNATKGNITKHEVLMMENNFSDHRPIHIRFDLCLSDKLIGSARTLKDVKHYVTRWDKCNLNEYYDASRVCIANVTVNTEYAWCTNNKCNDALHRHAITTHIVNLWKPSWLPQSCQFLEFRVIPYALSGTVN